MGLCRRRRGIRKWRERAPWAPGKGPKNFEFFWKNIGNVTRSEYVLVLVLGRGLWTEFKEQVDYPEEGIGKVGRNVGRKR